MTIAENCERVLERMHEAAVRAGRKDEAQLIAVTKFVEAERIAEAFRAGIHAVGENRVQELLNKKEFFEKSLVDIHFIGQLQTNKVKYVIGGIKLIQSMDRLPLFEQVQNAAAREEIVQDVLLEVNIGREEQKSGVLREDIPALLDCTAGMKNIRVKGLMCIPPPSRGDEARKYFSQMHELFFSLGQGRWPNVSMQELSMGMSGDYYEAVLEGATMVRVGTALFGARVVKQ